MRMSVKKMSLFTPLYWGDKSLVREALRQLVVAWPTLKMATMAFLDGLLTPFAAPELAR